MCGLGGAAGRFEGEKRSFRLKTLDLETERKPVSAAISCPCSASLGSMLTSCPPFDAQDSQLSIGGLGFTVGSSVRDLRRLRSTRKSETPKTHEICIFVFSVITPHWVVLFLKFQRF